MSNIDFLEQHKNRNLAMIRPPRQFRTYEPMGDVYDARVRALNDSNEHAHQQHRLKCPKLSPLAMIVLRSF